MNSSFRLSIFALPVLAALALLTVSRPAFAMDPVKDYVRVTSTQHIDLPATGTVRLHHALDEIAIEGWDQPGVEITTIKSTTDVFSEAEHDKAMHELDRIKIAAERKGDELSITTAYPTQIGFWPAPPVHHYAVEYRIKVPRTAHLIVDGRGEAHFSGISGDIEANMHQGVITVRLADAAQYHIDASSKFGVVISDFPGDTKRHVWISHSFTAAAQAPHKLVLKEGFGDIMILKIAPIPAA